MEHEQNMKKHLIIKLFGILLIKWLIIKIHDNIQKYVIIKLNYELI